MKIFIGFSKPSEFKIGAELISLWTNSPYSHVYMRFEYKCSKSAIFHAAHGMVHFKSPTNLQKENTIIKEYSIEVDQCEHDEIFDECMELAGEPYSRLTLLKIFLSDIIFYTTGRVINWSNSPGYICSELVGKVCTDRLNIHFNKPIFLLKPNDIDQGLANGALQTDN